MCVCLATGISVYFADLKSGEGAGKVAEMHGCTIQYARRAAITGPQKRKMTVRILLSAQAYQKKENNYCRALYLHFKPSAIQEMYQIETVDLIILLSKRENNLSAKQTLKTRLKLNAVPLSPA